MSNSNKGHQITRWKRLSIYSSKESHSIANVMMCLLLLDVYFFISKYHLCYSFIELPRIRKEVIHLCKWCDQISFQFNFFDWVFLSQTADGLKLFTIHRMSLCLLIFFFQCSRLSCYLKSLQTECWNVHESCENRLNRCLNSFLIEIQQHEVNNFIRRSFHLSR